MEAFLLEVLVVGENSGQTLAAHGLHGDAVGEAVALVGTASIKIEPGQNCLGKEDHRNARPHRHVGRPDSLMRSSKTCRQKPASLLSLGNTVDVVVVLAGSVCRELGAFTIGYVGPDAANSRGKRRSCW